MWNENRVFLEPENLELLGPLEKKRCEGSRDTGAEGRAGVGVEQEQGSGAVMGTGSCGGHWEL